MKTFLVLLGLFALISCTPVPDAATSALLLRLHNIERREVGLADLTWNTTLAKSAQAWADNLATNGGLKHSGTSGVGENLAKASFRKDLVAFLFSLWANEKQNFDGSKKYPDCKVGDGAVGHYTQIMWGRTVSVGCGIANTSASSVLVCQYYKAGNYIGSWTYTDAEIVNIPGSEPGTPNIPTDPTTPTTPTTPTNPPTNNTNTTTPTNPPTNTTNPVPPTNNTNTTNPVPPTNNTVDFPTQMLNLHNAERAQFKAPNLIWSTKLAASAQKWADYLATKTRLYESDTYYGENLARLATKTNVNMIDTLFAQWSMQKSSFISTKKYPYCTTGGNVDEYSQVLWYRTTQVGCGFSKTRTGKYSILVCHYSKRGNSRGYYVVPQGRRLRGEDDEN